MTAAPQRLILVSLFLCLAMTSACTTLLEAALGEAAARQRAPATQTPAAAAATAELVLGRLVTATGTDSNACPIDVTSVFTPDQDVYVVAASSTIPQGTRVFARLSYDGTTIEDTDDIVADRDYRGACVYFVFEHVNDEFTIGGYSVVLMVNGQPGPVVKFAVK